MEFLTEIFQVYSCFYTVLVNMFITSGLKNPVFLISFGIKLITMIAVNGTYVNGVITLEKKIRSKRSLKVIVTFLDDEIQSDSKRLTTKDFSFGKSREKSKRYDGSLSDAVIDDRKSESN